MVGRKEIEQIERLYELYGFSKVKEADKFIVFTYSNGYFYNAEIIKFDSDIEVDHSGVRYSKAGIKVL